ncbi:DUF2017 family protein [Iamia sp. SCSIO 61187]|uniref:DUF2017 family protein n=1 Tax=Iamia sp. SCSIO 61187 TaxID=2722752 RepID=UPI001C632CC8|nr:DUF2017 family protein [Iamia sp. SCSIO 61187]QYG91094.1 DUF2017 family protein [Iamia sp. SCSIO 61187]
MARKPVARKRDGTYVLRLDDAMTGLLTALVDQLDPLLDDPSADRGLRRLFPPAHTDDVLAEAAWEIEQGGRLRDARRAALEVVRTAGGEPLTEDQLVAWVQGVNALRLVLAERLDVDGDEEHEATTLERAWAVAQDPTADPARRDEAVRLVHMWQVYEVLGYLLHHAVEALD